MKLKNMLRLTLISGLMSSGIATAASNVYFVPGKQGTFGVASDDKKALMFVGVDKNADIKGMCFALEEQAESIVPGVDIYATVDETRFRLYGLRVDQPEQTKELVCSVGSEAMDFLSAVGKSCRSILQFNFYGDSRKYSFDTVAYSKLLSGDKKILEQVTNDYIHGARAPVIYAQNSKIKAKPLQSVATESSDKSRFQRSDQELNATWKNLSAETRKRLLPSQRDWIKRKDAACKTDIKCLTEMTDKRVVELKVSEVKE